MGKTGCKTTRAFQKKILMDQFHEALEALLLAGVYSEDICQELANTLNSFPKEKFGSEQAPED